VTLEWVLAPFRFIAALYKATQLFRFQHIDLVASAGGYTAVPVILAAKVYGVKIWVHQQDVDVLLTNRLTAPLADYLTAAWSHHKITLGKNTHVIGNPVRMSILEGSRERAYERFHLDTEKQTVLVVGGGSGAVWLNAMIDQIASRLITHVNLIHVTGKGKSGASLQHKDYHTHEFLNEDMKDAYALADVVVSRAGLGTITELSALAKAAIIIPLPDSPQESNARMIESACLVLNQKQVTPDFLLTSIIDLLNDSHRRKDFGQKLQNLFPTRIADEVVDRLVSLLEKSQK
jgi:UDP-N-acetylglucosamine--N-acetylmuramyl-(pentapeptide) pyrophosphoryl-undecaprenol N-acetylglucosamine transferase